MHAGEWAVLGFAAGLAIVLLTAADKAPADAAGRLTARQAVERIKRNVTCEWNEKTVDTFKAGDPDTPVTGIATTFTATLDVLRRAAASGKNLIITHEPTFYQHTEDTREIEADKVLEAKRAFLKDHGLVVWRFHDHWHRHQPDGINQGMVEKFGWQAFRRPGDEVVFRLPETSVRRLAETLRDTFKTDTIRVVGDPDLKVSGVGFSAGAPPALAHLRLLQRDDVEVLVAGEAREWETVEYVRDAAAAGKHKALVLLGHAVSEETGMEYCARWLKGFITEVPVEFIPAGNPFWSPSGQ
jgi:putative NIF3 family GTP cyclohydrolase 1 type 2